MNGIVLACNNKISSQNNGVVDTKVLVYTWWTKLYPRILNLFTGGIIEIDHYFNESSEKFANATINRLNHQQQHHEEDNNNNGNQPEEMYSPCPSYKEQATPTVHTELYNPNPRQLYLHPWELNPLLLEQKFSAVITFSISGILRNHFHIFTVPLSVSRSPPWGFLCRLILGP